MSRKCIEIAIQILYIYFHVRSTLSTVNYHDCTMFMSNFSYFFNRIHYTKHIGHIGSSYNLGLVSYNLLCFLQSNTSIWLKWNIF
ncbi:hypothetical protein D3C73_1423510 [compost metagenome]